MVFDDEGLVGETVVLTPDGERALGELVGTAKLLTRRPYSLSEAGVWASSWVSAVGRMPCFRVSVVDSGCAETEVVATAGFKWYGHGGRVLRTSGLTRGDSLASVYPVTGLALHVWRVLRVAEVGAREVFRASTPVALAGGLLVGGVVPD